MNNSKDSIIPEMMGSEHELSVAFSYRHKSDSEINDDPERLGGSVNNDAYELERLFRVPNKLEDTLWENSTSSTKILKNGSVFMEYTERPLEIATPECSSPSQLVAYSVASRMMVAEWAKSLLEESSYLRSISLHERVIDSYGNTWGEHDNFSISKDQKKWGYIANETPGVVWLHALTRGCVSGAGHINGGSRQWTLSQKTPTVTEISNKKWGSTGFFNADNRIEIRCSDKNVSQWAHIMRIGSMAMVLALAHADYDTKKIGIDQNAIYDSKYIGTFDNIRINTSGEVKFSHVAKIAVSVQKSLAEASMQAIEKGDIPESYKPIAKNWLSHCESLEKDTLKDDPIDLSRYMYTDWAAKFYYIQHKIKQDNQVGLDRSPFDYSSMAQDLYYDRILFDAPEKHSKVYMVEGTGYKLNKRIAQRNIIAMAAIKNAMQQPPETTRASDRVAMIKNLTERNCHIDYVDWELIEWIDETHDTYKHYF